MRDFTIKPDQKSSARLPEGLTPPPYHPPMPENLTQFDFHHRLAERKSPTLVYFSSEGCGSCRHLKDILTSVKDLHPNWTIFEVDAQREMALTREFEVFHLPTLFLFTQGRFHAELRCESTPTAIEGAVLDALQQPAQEAP